MGEGSEIHHIVHYLNTYPIVPDPDSINIRESLQFFQIMNIGESCRALHLTDSCCNLVLHTFISDLADRSQE